MKKLILILTLIFAIALCFVACEELGDNSKEGQSINALSGGVPETEEPTTEAPTTEKPASEEPTTEGKTFTELSTNKEKDKKLYLELVNFLEMKDGGGVAPVLGDLGSQLERNLFWGNQVTHVRFDSSDYYYVCGYYTDDHQAEAQFYCCSKKYTWIIVENESEIPESYNNLKFIVAFQINKTLSAVNIATNSAVNTVIEHYMEYDPLFVDGINVAKKLQADFTYILFVNHDEFYKFDTTTDFFHDTYTLSCIEIDGEWYLWYKVAAEDIELHFGAYYDALVGVTKEYGKDCVIIEFSDFAEAVLK